MMKFQEINLHIKLQPSRRELNLSLNPPVCLLPFPDGLVGEFLLRTRLEINDIRKRSAWLEVENGCNLLKALHSMKDVYPGARHVADVSVNKLTQEKAA